MGNDVGILLGADDNSLGGSVAGAGNLISGNQFGGIMILGGANNTIQGNLLGTDVTGSAPLGNGWDGVYLYGTNGNVIGGVEPGARNVISGSGWNGLILLLYRRGQRTLEPAPASSFWSFRPHDHFVLTFCQATRYRNRHHIQAGWTGENFQHLNRLDNIADLDTI